ncbi:hypothetical protein, partial [Paenibacillus lactis]|uniref:hypothetical protein n=1 Tax=Paenibacillus lactis TaxID=228574 RepID=UPI0039F0CEA1
SWNGIGRGCFPILKANALLLRRYTHLWQGKKCAAKPLWVSHGSAKEKPGLAAKAGAGLFGVRALAEGCTWGWCRGAVRKSSPVAHKSDFSRLLIFVCKFFTSALNFVMSSLISDRLTASFTIRYRTNKTTKIMTKLAIRPPKPNAEPISTPPYHGILLNYLQLYHYTRSSFDRMVKTTDCFAPGSCSCGGWAFYFALFLGVGEGLWLHTC